MPKKVQGRVPSDLGIFYHGQINCTFAGASPTIWSPSIKYATINLISVFGCYYFRNAVWDAIFGVFQVLLAAHESGERYNIWLNRGTELINDAWNLKTNGAREMLIQLLVLLQWSHHYFTPQYSSLPSLYATYVLVVVGWNVNIISTVCAPPARFLYTAFSHIPTNMGDKSAQLTNLSRLHEHNSILLK